MYQQLGGGGGGGGGGGSEGLSNFHHFSFHRHREVKTKN